MISKNGLTSQEVENSKQQFGTNQLSAKEKDSIFKMLIDSFKDVWILVLCAALGIKIIIAVIGCFVPALSSDGEAVELVSIALAILLSTGFSTLSEYRNTSRAEALQEEYNKTYAKVMRNGQLISILTSEIVKGDVVLVQAGDKVPVDGIIFEGSIKVSQAALNGESRDETKVATGSLDDADSSDYSNPNKVFMGSVVTSGEAYMIATVIGDATELGIINKSLTSQDDNERKDTSSLKLEVVAKQIGKLGGSAAALAAILHVVLTLLRFDGPADSMMVIMTIMEAIMLACSIVIMAVPEGLPMMNSLVQSMNTESLYKKNIMVSHKAAFSDSAYMDILFSDKTGTISQGVLSLVEFIKGDGSIVSDIVNNDFINAITLNNLAKVSEGKAIGSNNMDRALLNYAIAHGYNENQKNIDNVAEISGFDSEKKCATVTMKDGTIFWKGATESIIDKITHYMDNEEVLPFSTEQKNIIQERMIEQAKRTMKLLSVVKIDGDKVILYAVLCLRDNVRVDAAETVSILTSAGIQTVMVTGDMEETAIAIAKEAGIYTENSNDIALTHNELEAMTDEELANKLQYLKVVSRAKPMDKKRLVTVAQSMGRVAGMTGDGVNDSPALKQADVGFAMGDGTAVAQEAGDVVILNNSLTSIKDAVLNSRTMAKSVGKFLIFQLTVNVSTLLINILAPILGWMEPFSIVSILWINLIMDTLAALAFGGEPILDRYMDEKPVKRDAPILTKYIKSAIATSAIFITLGSVLILENFAGILDFVRPISGVIDINTYDKTFMFAFFIYSIIFNSLNTRSETLNIFEHINQNKKFIFVMSGIFVMQTILLEIGGPIFGTAPLTIKGYIVSIILALLIIPVDMVRKLIVSKK